MMAFLCTVGYVEYPIDCLCAVIVCNLVKQ
jgi:hypothetical protein